MNEKLIEKAARVVALAMVSGSEKQISRFMPEAQTAVTALDSAGMLCNPDEMRLNRRALSLAIKELTEARKTEGVLQIDLEAECAYVAVKDVERAHRTTEHTGTVNLDWDADGELIGVELLDYEPPAVMTESGFTEKEIREMEVELYQARKINSIPDPEAAIAELTARREMKK